MPDYYHEHDQAYFEKTVALDSSFFLMPFVKRLPPGSKVLDVGCGSGRDLRWLKQQGFQVTGLDRSPGLAALAGKHAGCMVIEDDFQTFDFSKLSMDAVMMSGSLVHIPHQRMAEIINRIKPALDCPDRARGRNRENANGVMYISLKEGKQYRSDPDGRIFYYWQDADLRIFVRGAWFLGH